MQAAGHPLAAMALDFMSIPGEHLFQCHVYLQLTFLLATSTDVERAFSRGGLTISKLRSLTSLLMLLQFWDLGPPWRV